MAAVSSMSLCTCCTPCSSSPSTSPLSSPSQNSVCFGAFRPVEKLSLIACNAGRSRVFAVTSDDEWGEDKVPPGRPEPLEESVPSAVGVATAVEEEEGSSVAELKRALVDSLCGTDRGLKASSDVRAEIVELISQLEAKNPTPAPTQALPLLNGKWILAYTSFSELFPLLAAGTLPLVKVGEISQFVDSNALTVENSVTFTGPLATTSFSTSATFEVRSPKRVQIKFEEGVIGTPQLTDSIEIPENVQVMGQNVDLKPVQGLLKSLQDAASSVARSLSGQPPLKFPIRTDRAQSWLLTTYLDSDLRISRGDGGSIFVLLKDGSELLEDL
ncbi:hypothetical protein GOP47_0013852 [Adiantum capillus-veneris]|uniref:Plastid lipid-associated protein/fibrillin conserved domain-containing protein n=1 Tax=Adiantum capillus-veneris TaxID=13818 RepID=A0A9D4UPI6_ADICA|nr:hypothetical protein GOP47_0013852 [Adiantum capillus-veneris]